MFLSKVTKVTNIKEGDLILSRDIVNKQDQYREVIRTMNPIVDDQIEISTASSSVCTSRNHPTAVVREGIEQYIKAGQVILGDILITLKGYECVEDIRDGNYSHNFIDFTIDKNNNYYAGNSPDNLILGHNSATMTYLIWHHEIEDLLVLKNNKGTEETRIRNMDYSVALCGLFYERYLKNEDMTLFSPHEVPDLLEAFYSDQIKFKELYEKYERSTKIKKKRVSTREILNALMIERKETGRIYILNVDNTNIHGPFKPEVAPIKQSNLCMEITLPVKPMGYEDSTIALCTLAAINFGKINSPEEFEKPCKYSIRFLDNLLTYQNYLVPESERHTKYYRPLGVGVTNIAYWMAKNGLSYTGDQKTLDMVDEYMEAFQYYLVRASCDLAKELGPCEKYKDTKYSDGLTSIDWYKKTVDQLVKPNLRMDWKSLKEDLKQYGIRNATVSALMPAECVHWKHKVTTDKGLLNFHDIADLNDIDWNSIESNDLNGWYELKNPLKALTHTGEYKDVLGLYYNGMKHIIKITLNNGKVVECTPEHKLAILNNGAIEWKRAADLREGDDICEK